MAKVVQSDFLVGPKKAMFDWKLEVMKAELHQIGTSPKPACYTRALELIPRDVGGLQGTRQTLFVCSI